MYNDILAIVTLEGNIRDKDIDHYAKKYIDIIGGLKGAQERTFWENWREAAIKDFYKLPSTQQEELSFLRYLLSGWNPELLKKSEFKSRITSYEENRAYIKKVWLLAIIDNPIKYLHHRLMYAKILYIGHFYNNGNWAFTKPRIDRDFILSYGTGHIPIWVVITFSLISSLLYFKFIKKYDSIIISTLLIVFINLSVITFVVPVPQHRYIFLDAFLITLLTARNLISLVYYVFTKNKA